MKNWLNEGSRRKRIYILPTRFGLVFILGAILMILIGASYQNNLVNLLAYFMLSLIFIAMIQTHNNLTRIHITSVDVEGGFAGGEIVITTTLGNAGTDSRFAIESDVSRLKLLSRYENHLPLIGQGALKLRSSYRAEKRGRFELKRVKLSTTYPLGLFRSWQWYPVSTTYFVYPERKSLRPPPSIQAPTETALQTLGHAGDDFSGHRRYETGDSAKHIDWKARARGRPLLVKQFMTGEAGALEFDWSRLASLTDEDRLSQLAEWIDTARRTKSLFVLKLPGTSLPASHGLQYSVRCLEALAAFDSSRVKRRSS